VIQQQSFQLLIERLEASTTKPEAVAALARFVSGIDIEHYAYLGFQGQGPRQPEPFKAGTYPSAWVDEYMGDRLYVVDPIVLAATQSTLPVAWSGSCVDKDKASKPVRQMFERATDFGIRSGYTIPIRSSIGQLATITFASSLEADEFSELLGRCKAELHLGAFHFHDAIERISAPARGAHLTPRERTCLMFSSQGLSAKEIARVLDLSPRSVKFHHDNARVKLGATNLKQAIGTATCIGLI
jgi:LuxR family transcriptional activator of conjugal transfer of Ti plasmids